MSISLDVIGMHSVFLDNIDNSRTDVDDNIKYKIVICLFYRFHFWK